jgi:hypothetical protein
MQVIHDTVWDKCLADAVKMFRLNEPDDKCHRLADATWNMKRRYQEHANKRQNRQVIMIDKNPEIISEQRASSKKLCAAVTICKKHQAKPLKLGAKIDMKKIKIND